VYVSSQLVFVWLTTVFLRDVLRVKSNKSRPRMPALSASIRVDGCDASVYVRPDPSAGKVHYGVATLSHWYLLRVDLAPSGGSLEALGPARTSVAPSFPCCQKHHGVYAQNKRTFGGLKVEGGLVWKGVRSTIGRLLDGRRDACLSQLDRLHGVVSEHEVSEAGLRADRPGFSFKRWVSEAASARLFKPFDRPGEGYE